MNQKQLLMKTRLSFLLLAVFFSVMSTFAQRDPYNPNNYWNDQGCWGTINIEVGETKTISCSGHIPDLNHLTFSIWSEHFSAGYIKVISQNWTSCTIEGMTSGTGNQLWYLFEYGTQDYPYNTYKAYYLVNVTSKGKLNLSASPAGGKVVKGTKVYLTADQPNADIYYAINGVATTSSPKYTSEGITIDEPCTLSAIATKRGYDSSDRMSWTFTVEDGVEINATNFPDANFRDYLLAQDYGKDGFITKAEIANITKISVQNKNISSLKGIEYFTALNYLYCDNPLTTPNFNHLTELDVSKNTALEYLACSENQLTALDVSKNTALTFLNCSSNQLKSMDVSKNTALKIYSCGDNQLTSVDISKNTKLEELGCFANQLTSLDVSKNTALTFMNCSRNMIKGAAMDALISGLPVNTTGDNVGKTYSVYLYNDTGTEGNVCTKKQVAAFKAKGWTPKYYADNVVGWIDYEGSGDDSEEPDNPTNPTAPVSITLPEMETVNVNSTIQLTPVIEPANAVTELTWTSDDETIAKVTSTGRVAGIKVGTAIISVRTSNNLTAECFVVVQDASGIEEIKADGSTGTSVYMLSGQKVENPTNIKKGIYIVNGKKVTVK